MIRQSPEALALSLTNTLLTSNWGDWLSEVATAFHGNTAHLIPLGEIAAELQSAVSAGFDLRAWDEYANTYHKIDVFAARFVAKPPGRAIRLHELVTEEEMLSSSVYHEYCLKYELVHPVSVRIELSSSEKFIFSVTRARGQGRFSDQELRSLEYVGRHVHKTLQVHRMVRGAARSEKFARLAIDQVSVPIFVLSTDLRLRFANRAGSEMLDRESTLRVRIGTGKVYADGVSSSALQRAMESVARGLTTQAIISLKTDTSFEPSMAVVTMVSGEEMAELGYAVADASILVSILRGGPRRQPSEMLLVEAFQLTSREAETASLLAGGADLREIADVLKIGREGVRQHLKRLFLKTGTHNQKDLVHAILRISQPIDLVQQYQNGA